MAEYPSCGITLIRREQEIETDFWSACSTADRLWPRPKCTLDSELPEIIEVSLQEANGGPFARYAQKWDPAD
jgi:hypothetical protein